MVGETGDLPEMLRMMRCRRGFQYSAATVSPDSSNDEKEQVRLPIILCFPEQDSLLF